MVVGGCRLLQGALGGAGETAIIICCSPGIKSAQETLSTLRFGARAQGIVNTVQVLLCDNMRHHGRCILSPTCRQHPGMLTGVHLAPISINE